MVTQFVKYLKINKKYKILLKEVKEGLNKQRDTYIFKVKYSNGSMKLVYEVNESFYYFS